MKTRRIVLAALLALLAWSSAQAQEKPNAGSASADTTAVAASVRIQVVLTEYDGTKKIASLPYVLPYAVTDERSGRGSASLRVGVRVPIAAVSSKTGENTIQYTDIGTNIDARAKHLDGDRYAVELTVERSSLYSRAENKEGKTEGKEWTPGDPAPGSQPLVRQFRGNVTILVHDGHGAEATVATDPLTGHSLKVEVLLTSVT